MHVKMIDIGDIEVHDRLRPVNEEAIKGLAEDIAKRGLRQPIEVVGQVRGKAYRLVAGAHRLAACKLAGLEEIAALVVSGTILELRRAEILENLVRNELSKLERAQFLAELKRLYQEDHPDAKHGGDRTTDQAAILADWYAAVAMRSRSSLRSVEQYSAIGKRLSVEAAETLRGTGFDDSLKELEALASLEPSRQIDVAQRLTSDADDRPKSVAQAIKAIDGHADEELSTKEKQLNKLMDAWSRASGDARNEFLGMLRETGEMGVE